MADLKTSKRLKTSIIILILLALCLAATTIRFNICLRRSGKQSFCNRYGKNKP